MTQNLKLIAVSGQLSAVSYSSKQSAISSQLLAQALPERSFGSP